MTGQNVVIPKDAEVSDELIQVLAHKDISPEDIEVVTDEFGRSIVRPRQAGSAGSSMSNISRKQSISQAMGGVKEGHVFHTPQVQAKGQFKVILSQMKHIN